LLLVLLCVCGAAVQKPDAEALFRDAMQAQQRGDAAAAVSKYEHLLRLYPNTVAARANLAVELVSLGRFDEAIKQYRTALTQAPGNFDLQLNLGIAYYKQENYSAAADEFRSLNKADPGNARVGLLLSDCDSRLGRDAEAISVLSPLEKTDPQNLAIASGLGSALIRTGRAQEGLERIEKVAQQGHSAEAYALAADTYMKLNLFDRARSNLDEATRLNPNLPGLHTLSGTVMDSSGDQEGAAVEFQKALAENPNDFEAQLRLGSVLYAQRKLDDARLHVNRALELEPTSSLARYQLARVERAQGQLDAAAGDLEKVERDDPGWLPPHVELAALYYRLNRPEDGAREKQIVDQISAEEQERQAKSPIIAPTLPSH
jgi:tetratricopeptide (TPR) repeat protein